MCFCMHSFNHSFIHSCSFMSAFVLPLESHSYKRECIHGYSCTIRCVFWLLCPGVTYTSCTLVLHHAPCSMKNSCTVCFIIIRRFCDTQKTLFTDQLMKQYHVAPRGGLFAKTPMVLSQAAKKRHTGCLAFAICNAATL